MRQLLYQKKGQKATAQMTRNDSQLKAIQISIGDSPDIRVVMPEQVNN